MPHCPSRYYPAALPFLLAQASCTSLSAVDVTYEPCVAVKATPYAEGFNGTYQDLLDRCWETDPAPAGTKVFTGDGDLIVRPVRGATWSATAQGTMLFRRMKGDFLVASRVEAASTVQSDHCVVEGEAAGLAVRKGPLAWSTLLVRPYFDPTIPMAMACKDEAAHPPTTRLSVATLGFGAAAPKDVSNVGLDAEAYVAMCRQGDQLAYYYRAESKKLEERVWILFHRHIVATGPVDVGITTTASPVGGTDSGMEGHFPWVVFEDHGDPVPDGCDGALERLVEPEEG